MAAKYKPSPTHTFLSTKARALSPEDLEVYSVLSEDLLGLTGTDYTGDKAASATSAVALEVSYLLQIPTELAYLQSQSRGARSESYRDVVGGRIMIDMIAGRIVRGLADPGSYARIPSVRGRNVLTEIPTEIIMEAEINKAL